MSESCLRTAACLDSDALAASRRRELDLPHERAAELGASAVEAIHNRSYRTGAGRQIDISRQIAAAKAARVSIPPDLEFPVRTSPPFPETATLEGDPMYDAHRRRDDYESSDWAILSPHVPVFRTDDGTALEEPWLLSVITCAAPVAKRVGQPRSAELLRARILRVLDIARAWGYESLVLGAWGCGAFGNDPKRTAEDFRSALEGPFTGAFRQVVFAITDWSPERRFLAPFRDTFAHA